MVGESTCGDTESVLRRYSTLIRDVAGLRTHALALDASVPPQFEAALRALPDEVGVLFLPTASSEFACRVRAVADSRPVLTGQDTTAIALAAALLTTLTRAGRAPRASQVVIAGADALPILCPLLVACGVGSVTTWSLADAEAFPLCRVTAGVDVVVNLLARELAGPEPAVIAPQHVRDPLLALPGLLRAMTRTPNAPLDVEVHHACTLALVMATPPEELLPHGLDRVLTEQVTDAATTALRESANRPF